MMAIAIKLRNLRTSDTSRLAQLANNRKIYDNVRDRFPHPYTEKNAEEFIEYQEKNDTEKVFAITYQGEFCGMIGLLLQEDVYRRTAEIGFWIGEPYWGKGIATKAVELIVDYAFTELKLIRVYAGVFEFNESSMRVLEKNGFTKEGIAKKAVIKNANICDEHRFAILKEDYKNRLLF